MKKLFILILVLTSLQSCKKAHHDYISFSGKIENTTDTVLTISNRAFHKKISINNDGTFDDTLKISNKDFYTLRTNTTNKSFLYLKNGFDIHLTTDNATFLESSNYTGGDGASSNNYFIAQYNFGRSIGDPKNLFTLNKVDFESRLKGIKHSFDSIKSLFKDIDSTVIKISNQQNQGFFDFLEKNYEAQHAASSKTNKLSKGNSSPKFKNYINYKGGSSSLDSFKGSYVYIDIWATWCKPCLREIPALKNLEKQYHGKNIQFLSISIDNKRTAGSWEQAKAKWQKMVSSKNLSGVQLYAGQNLEFIQKYQVSSIPRFILIDPKGMIVDANAPRPSNPRLVTLFNGLGI
ncbi:MAG: TlpA disulfide reductase family protein [Polaribacter sp.]|nr:TlpA disulfide reductase family protein [Polaribacter sp.]